MIATIAAWIVGLSCCALLALLFWKAPTLSDGNVGPESDDVIEAQKWMRWLKLGEIA